MNSLCTSFFFAVDHRIIYFHSPSQFFVLDRYCFSSLFSPLQIARKRRMRLIYAPLLYERNDNLLRYMIFTWKLFDSSFVTLLQYERNCSRYILMNVCVCVCVAKRFVKNQKNNIMLGKILWRKLIAFMLTWLSHPSRMFFQIRELTFDTYRLLLYISVSRRKSLKTSHYSERVRANINTNPFFSSPAHIDEIQIFVSRVHYI